ncbi:MAG: hypothetical protein QOG33_2035, partial [Gaiellales bacterium]|nr:hypothetical protein [Gaiellales bacterium]
MLAPVLNRMAPTLMTLGITADLEVAAHR